MDLLWPVGMDGQKSRDNSFAIVDLFISPELLHLFRDRAGTQKRREGEGDQEVVKGQQLQVTGKCVVVNCA